MNIKKIEKAVCDYLTVYGFEYHKLMDTFFFEYSGIYDYEINIFCSENDMRISVYKAKASYKAADRLELLKSINKANGLLKAGGFYYNETTDVVYYKEFVNFSWMEELPEKLIDDAVMFALSSAEEFFSEFEAVVDNKAMLTQDEIDELLKPLSEEIHARERKGGSALWDNEFGALDECLLFDDDDDFEIPVKEKKSLLEQVLFGN